MARQEPSGGLKTKRILGHPERHMKTSELKEKANPRNPRRISDEALTSLANSLATFGDLGCLVRNVVTGLLVSGHQRANIMDEGEVVIEQRYKKPNKQGTVAEGYVNHKGERYKYREVKWEESAERAAMIAANKHGGEWAGPELKELLLELDSGQFDITLTGFSMEELEAMMTAAPPERGSTPADQLEGYENSSVRQIVLILSVKEFEQTLPKLELLREKLEVDTNTEAILSAIDFNARHYTGKSQAGPKAIRIKKSR